MAEETIGTPVCQYGAYEVSGLPGSPELQSVNLSGSPELRNAVPDRLGVQKYDRAGDPTSEYAIEFMSTVDFDVTALAKTLSVNSVVHFLNRIQRQYTAGEPARFTFNAIKPSGITVSANALSGTGTAIIYDIPFTNPADAELQSVGIVHEFALSAFAKNKSGIRYHGRFDNRRTLVSVTLLAEADWVQPTPGDVLEICGYEGRVLSAPVPSNNGAFVLPQIELEVMEGVSYS